MDEEAATTLDRDYAGAPRPEQRFFEDEALDRAVGMIFSLATELWVVKDRMAALERALADRGVLDIAALDAEPGDAERQAMAAERQAFVRGLMENLLGTQMAKGVPDRKG